MIYNMHSDKLETSACSLLVDKSDTMEVILTAQTNGEVLHLGCLALKHKTQSYITASIIPQLF
jgi:hypothetical protein